VGWPRPYESSRWAEHGRTVGMLTKVSCPPHRGQVLSHTGDSAQRFKGAKRRAAPKRMVPPGAAKGIRDDGARIAPTWCLNEGTAVAQ
jgi:hypothetical protein